MTAPRLGYDRYGLLFVLLLFNIALLLVLPAGPMSSAFEVLVVTVTMLIAFRTSDAPPRAKRLAWIGAGVSLLFGATTALTGNARWGGLAHVLCAVLLAVAIVVILRNVATAEKVSGGMVMGGLCVYLVIGLLFAFLFMGYATVSGQDFFTQEGTHQANDFVYFSYITMATVGYGDLTPAGDVPRLLAISDALLGQIFLVTAVARLVGTWQLGERLRPTRHRNEED